MMFIFNYNSGWFPLPAATVPALIAAVLTAQRNQWPISDIIGTNGGSFAAKYEPPSHSRQKQIELSTNLREVSRAIQNL